MTTVYENLTEDDIKVVKSIQRRIDSSVESLVSDLQYLIDNLNQYKAVMKESVNTALEETDILLKYYDDGSKNVYNLPGTFASTTSNLDINGMKADSERLRKASEAHDLADNQRTSTYSIISQTYSQVRQRLNLLAEDNIGITQQLEQLKEKNNQD